MCRKTYGKICLDKQAILRQCQGVGLRGEVASEVVDGPVCFPMGHKGLGLGHFVLLHQVVAPCLTISLPSSKGTFY